ncbi:MULTISPECIES: TetR/AcrR family transcriptional regulator [unclassified Streptomyces]|uniref:TetR/AcrR family transcriptional regulator n=1 Tax=unclassified Streptomyces TaxID=2593676 RepID=UPI000CD59255|nr:MULTISPECIES: TetR/AcrR family transcriptional regulator [unclassified Streptomyces]
MSTRRTTATGAHNATPGNTAAQLRERGPRPDEGTPRRSGAATRARILDTAAELFYANGLRAVSADRIIERVGITKVTFYRHFRTKDELIVAYLERRTAWEHQAMDDVRAAAGDDIELAVARLAHGMGTEICRPGFRGCPFINAAAEYADPDQPVRRLVATHREWFIGQLRELLTAAGIAHPEPAAQELMMLRDGAAIAGYLGDPTTVANALERAALAIITAHR